MATKYWVGNSGTWTRTTGTSPNWSNSSGGAGGDSIPRDTDTIVFDANSFSLDDQVVTLNGSIGAGNIIIEASLGKAFSITGNNLYIRTGGNLHILTNLQVDINIGTAYKVYMMGSGEVRDDYGNSNIQTLYCLGNTTFIGNLNIVGVFTLDSKCYGTYYMGDPGVIVYSVSNALFIFQAGCTYTCGEFVTKNTNSLTGYEEITIESDDEYSDFTISCASGHISLIGDLSLKNCNAAGGATFDALTSWGCVDAGGNTGWTFVPYEDRYWIGGTGSWTDSAHWSTSSGGSGGASVPTRSNNVILDSHSFSANNQRIDIGSSFCASIIAQVGTRPFIWGYGGGHLYIHGDLTMNGVSSIFPQMEIRANATVSGIENSHFSMFCVGYSTSYGYYGKYPLVEVTLEDGGVLNIDQEEIPYTLGDDVFSIYGKFYFSNAIININRSRASVIMYGNTNGLEFINTSGVSTINIIGSIEVYVYLSRVGYYSDGIIDFGTSNINIESDGPIAIFSDVDSLYVDLIASDCDLYLRAPSIFMNGVFNFNSVEIDANNLACAINTAQYDAVISVIDSFAIINTSAVNKSSLINVDILKDSGVVSLFNTILSGDGASLTGTCEYYALYSNGCLDHGYNSSRWIFGKPKNLSMSPTLIGITSNIQLTHAPDWKNLPIIFSVRKNQFEDVSMVFAYCSLDVSTNIPFMFEVFAPGTYDFQHISVLFQVTTGIDYSDVPFHFSVIRQPQNFEFYIFQKLYCVTTELGVMFDDMQLQDWNVKPNQTWYVAVIDNNVYLYETLTDLLANTNYVAQGEIDSGTLKVVLHYLDEYGEEDELVECYYTDHPIHLSVSEIPTGTRMFRVKPLTDMAEIRHAIYNNSNITISRGEAELNLHTYAIKGREVVLGTHLPELECGDTVDLTSTRRNKTAEKSQVLSQTISGEVGDNGETSLITTINVANYTELFR